MIFTAAVLRVFRVPLPSGAPSALATLLVGLAAPAFAIAKNVTDEGSAWGAYLGVVLAALLGLGAVRHLRESGKVLPRALSPSAGDDADEAPDSPAQPH
ncbi:MAG: hypothetical protein FJW96_13585 [Actinobacteria bacterium]|nr:hypothetical protein [Actinomycetota bacterium]